MRAKDRILFSVYLNHRCNLRCSYCFINKLNDEKELTPSLLYKTIDLAAIYSKINDSECEIGFFGKEPLLSFGLIKKAVEYRRETRYKINYSLNTNGILLNKKMLNYLFRNNFRIVMSIDRLISEKWGSDSLFASQNKSIKIRTTINSRNIFILDSVINDLATLGFMNISIGFDYMDAGFAGLTDEMLSDCMIRGLSEYIRLKSKDLRFSIPLFDRILSAAVNKKRRRYSPVPFCRLGKNIFSVDIDGRIYPCWRFIGDKDMVIGDVRTGIIKGIENKIELKKSLRANIIPFDFVCYWAYKKSGDWFLNNLRLLKAMRRILLNIVNE